MAIISNFELLLNPIAPVVGPAKEIARVAIQGYFLQISNLENRDIKLIFRTRTNVKQSSDSVNTELTGNNHDVVYDITQDNIFVTRMTSDGQKILNKQWGHYVNCLNIPAGQSAIIAVLPRVQSLLTGPGGTPPDLAIRGYTELVLSSTVESINPTVFSDPDSARILVTPEHRGTFVDPEFDPANFATQTNLDFDQLAYSLPTANGQAQQLINTHARFDDPFQDFLTRDFVINSVISNPIQLNELGKNLSKDANSASRTTAFKIGNTPMRIEYSIKNGNYVVDEKSVEKIVKILLRKRKISKRAVGSVSAFTKKINNALSGNKRANDFLQKVFKDIK